MFSSASRKRERKGEKWTEREKEREIASNLCFNSLMPRHSNLKASVIKHWITDTDQCVLCTLNVKLHFDVSVTCTPSTAQTAVYRWALGQQTICSWIELGESCQGVPSQWQNWRISEKLLCRGKKVFEFEGEESCYFSMLFSYSHNSYSRICILHNDHLFFSCCLVVNCPVKYPEYPGTGVYTVHYSVVTSSPLMLKL